jgi:hypothetical protein
MIRYHFTTINGHVAADVEGTELRNLDEARVEATRLIGQILRDHPDRIWEKGKLGVQVYTDDNDFLFEIMTVIRPRPKSGGRPTVMPFGRDCRYG